MIKPIRTFIFAVLALLFLTVPISASAEEYKDTEYSDLKGSYDVVYLTTKFGTVYQGGRNTYRGYPLATTREEVSALENIVRSSNEYYLVNTGKKDLNDTTVDLFMNNSDGVFLPYMKYEAGDAATYLYLDKELFDYAVREIRKGGAFDIQENELLDCLLFSAVVIDYSIPKAKEMVGTIDLYDDALPDEKGAWVQISSPIDTVITFTNVDTKTIYQFPIEGGTTVLHKIRDAQYVVSNVNGLTLKWFDEGAICHHNQMQIGWAAGESPDNPFIIELEELVKKYDIKPVAKEYLLIGNSEVHPFSAYFTESHDAPEVTPEPEKEEKKSNKGIIAFFSIAAAITAVICIRIYKMKDDEDSEE